MSCFTVSRALFVRLLFTIHGITSIWCLHKVTQNPNSWYIAWGIVGLMAEAIVTIGKNRGHEWKWFCPSVFFYLLCVVPAIWFLELHQMERRIRDLKSNSTSAVAKLVDNKTEQELRADIEGLGFQIQFSFTTDEWLRTLEQILLLFLILGRWLLPKGKLTHDQLSQLLLVYIGTAADIVEFFEAFKEDEVKYNSVLCMTILGIWSWSLVQFTLVLTATKARRDRSGLVTRHYNQEEKRAFICCLPDVYGIIVSIIMQDLPYLVLRLLLIFKYGVLSYTNMFFTCKNTLVITLLLYRLVVVQLERKNALASKSGFGSSSYIPMSGSVYGSNSVLQKNFINWYDQEELVDYGQGYNNKTLKRKSNGKPLVEYNDKTMEKEDTEEVEVKFVIRPHHSPPSSVISSPVKSVCDSSSKELCGVGGLDNNHVNGTDSKPYQLNNNKNSSPGNEHVIKGVML